MLFVLLDKNLSKNVEKSVIDICSEPLCNCKNLETSFRIQSIFEQLICKTTYIHFG